MSSSNGQESKDQKPKKRSTLNFLFNPRIDREIEPIKESAGMFVRMLALIFASYRLFPQNHPAFNDPRIRLTMADVIGTAFRGLSFTKKGIPQIAVFVAVTGCLAFTILAIITILLSMFVGSANAQVFQYTETDWGVQWIDYLFMGEAMQTPSSTITPPSGTAMQVALGTALSLYSTAVLALAGFLLMYHLAFMIAEQAHSGKIMGRANQIWAPIRLVFAIGMLVPIGAGGGGSTVVGYNTAQYFAMQVGRWGSGLASNVWSNFVNNLNTASSFGLCEGGAGSPSCMNTTLDVETTVNALISMQACAYITNFYINQAQLNGTTQWNAGIGSFPEEIVATAGQVSTYGRVLTLADVGGVTPGRHALALQTSSSNNFRNATLNEFCGGYVVPQIPSGPYAVVYQAQLDQFASLVTRVQAYVSQNAMDIIPSSGVYSQRTLAARQASLNTLISETRNQLNTAIGTAFTQAQQQALTTVNGDLTNERFTTTGWLTAGTWFNQITKLMAQRSGSVRNALPSMIRPQILDNDFSESGRSGMSSVVHDAASDYNVFSSSVSDSIHYGNNGTITQNDVGRGFDSFSVSDLLDMIHPANFFFVLLDKAGVAMNLWRENGDLAISFGATLNPLAEIAAFGQNNVEIASKILSWSGLIYAITLIPGVNTISSSMASFLGGLGMTVAGLFYVVGFTLGFVVPLYPFFRFFFGSIQWIMTVFEAVVLAPLFALAHVSPQGEGLAGQYARYGYAVFMQVLLRPMLMVFGLIAGYLLFSAALHFLNDMFIWAARGTGAYTGGNEVIAKMVYVIIYCALVLVLANQCFSTIGLFPQVALAYLGMNRITEERISDTNLMAAGAAYVGKDVLMNKLPAASKAIPDAITGYKKSTTPGSVKIVP